MSTTWVELIGYLASGLVVASLAMSSVVRLRLVSLAGGIVFSVYGALLPSVPIIITNVAVSLLNIWFLSREFSPHRDLGAVPSAVDAPFLVDFLRSHTHDISRSHPEFTGTTTANFALILTRDGLPAGVLLGNREGNVLRLQLDYVMHAYRDSRIGSWLYASGSKVFTAAGITRIAANPASEVQRGYLRRVGFTEQPDGYAVSFR
ncbi:MAG: hypothetical protein WCF12_13645 [Propionicimonas sp.]